MLQDSLNQTYDLCRDVVVNFSPSLAAIYRLTSPVDDEGNPVSVSDGQGGILAVPNVEDQRTLIEDNVKCRVVVPRANREEAEYDEKGMFISETRVEIVFPYHTDVRAQDKIVVEVGGVDYSFEVKIVMPHTDEISRHVLAVKFNG